MTALESYLIGEPEHEDTADVAAPENLEQADWQIRKLGRLRRLMAENEAIAAIEIARVRQWLAAENQKLADQADFYESNLAKFHRHLLEFDNKRKTISLPGGTLKMRKHPDRVDVIDQAIFAAWAIETRPELVRIKTEPNKTEIKRLLAVGPEAGDYGLMLVDPETGTAAPGVVLVEGETSFTVDADHREVDE